MVQGSTRSIQPTGSYSHGLHGLIPKEHHPTDSARGIHGLLCTSTGLLCTRPQVRHVVHQSPCPPSRSRSHARSAAAVGAAAVGSAAAAAVAVVYWGAPRALCSTIPSHRLYLYSPLEARGASAWSECHPLQCPSSAPAPPQGASGGPMHLGTPGVGPGHWDPSHGHSCSSEPPPKSPISLPLTV